MNFHRLIVAIVVMVTASCVSVTPDHSGTKDIRSLLVRDTWMRHLDDKRFFADGTYESNERDSDYTKHGTWRLQGRILTMTEGKKTTTHRIIYIGPKELDMTFGDGSEGLQYTCFKEEN